MHSVCHHSRAGGSPSTRFNSGPRLRGGDVGKRKGEASVLLALLLCAAIATPAFAAPSRPLPPSHPLLGIWLLRIPGIACAETYHFRGDGTSIVKSAQEIGESEFTIADQPSANGYYRMEDRVVKANGKPDCSGEVTRVGDHVTSYVRFGPDSRRFVMCTDESLEACIGPFERVEGEGI